MDPLTDIAIPLLAGGIGGGVVGLVGASWQSRRDHRRWLRERRHEAYMGYLSAIDKTFLIGTDGDFTQVLDAQSALTLVGPGSIIESAQALFNAGSDVHADDDGGTDENHDALAVARARFVLRAQEALDVPKTERVTDSRLPG